MTETLRLHATGGCGPAVTGTALVSVDPFSPRYDLDRTTGVISRADHALHGHSIADTILVVPAPKGGVAAGWAIYALREMGIAPRGFVFTTVNPVFVQGAVHAGLPILHGFADDPVKLLSTGDLVRLDPAACVLTVMEPTT
ncbi:MAG: aconitase X swivel domain-containing protein [Micromonosporaceae bacterium]